jgi:phosphatidylglycerophosphate synthase
VPAATEVAAALARDPRTSWVEAVSALPASIGVVVAGDVAFLADLVRSALTESRAGTVTAIARCERGFVLASGAEPVARVTAAFGTGGLGATLEAISTPAAITTPTAAVAPILPAATAEERRAATSAVLRATGKAVDGPLTKLFERRISQAISSVLLPFPVSPNVVTTVSLAIGLTGAALLASTSYELRVIGAAVFVFATIVDGCDGEIARSKLLESPFGKVYDTAVDIVVNAAVLVGLGVGIWRELGGVPEIVHAVALLITGGFFAMAVVETVRRVSPPASPGSVLFRAQAWLERFATLEWCYLVLGLALVDQLPFFLFGAAVGANVFALVYLTLGVVAWRRA